jgi:16S rRNA (guanine966-N2)-methyltransferase
VESSPRAVKLIEQNLQSLGVNDGFQVVQADVLAGLRRFQDAGGVADFVFLDPPYRMQTAYRETLDFLSRSSVLRPASIVIAEHERKSDPGEAFRRLQRFRKLEQGDAALSFYRLSSGG